MKRALEVLGWLLAVALFAFAGRAVLAAAPAGQGGAGELTAREERGARELAARFAERLRAAEDLAPLLDELFIADFGERLRRAAGEVPIVFVAPEVLARAEPEELRRFYAAEFNYISLLLRHQVARCAESEESCGSQAEDLAPEQLFPPPVLEALADEPLFRKVIASYERDQACERAVRERPGVAAAECDGDEGETFITSLEELRAANEGAERVAAVVRRLVPPLPTVRKPEGGGAGAERFAEARELRLETFDRERYGFPPGTRFVSARVHLSQLLAFNLLAVEAGGEPRLVAAFPAFGH